MKMKEIKKIDNTWFLTVMWKPVEYEYSDNTNFSLHTKNSP